jgi:hypothetical protein
LLQEAAARAHPRWSLTQVRSIRNEPASAGLARLVVAGAADRDGIDAAVPDTDGERRDSPPRATAGEWPPQPAALITSPSAASHSHPRLTHHQTAAQRRRLQPRTRHHQYLPARPPRDGVETVEGDLLPVDIYDDQQTA